MLRVPGCAPALARLRTAGRELVRARNLDLDVDWVAHLVITS